MLKTFTNLLLLSVFFLLTIPTAFAQRLTHVQGEILVKLKADQPVRQWVKQKQQLRGIYSGLRFQKTVSKPVQIYALQFDHTQINENELLLALRRDPEVAAAQFNHLLALRSTVPNDPQFGSQWQYINTGQSGGLTGVDLDIDLAWDTTTGGLTADGDTIVVCVIDDGVEATHDDMRPNLWVNRAEIPDNGMDDDNNGYVDDYRGWDTGSNTDEVYDGGWHGTPVAGIVGAKGNNGIGVAGVNWDVKLMIIEGGTGVESEVLAAYSYPLDMRKRYNATNGAEGAFVVATNASWGIDRGQPADAPLWCAFYDTLGVHGILNAGATANADLDVDVDGDLPTGCTSDYLISVTNIGDNDTKVAGAAWGLNSVDLGAFGEGTWTVSIGNGYGGFGGTSGATPHVAGAIALLYSIPCPEIISQAKANPGEVALLMKEVILNGVDPNASLDGLTVTGGRMNINKSMELLLTRCGPCPAPFATTVSAVNDSSAQLDWQVGDSTLTTDLRWRALGSPDWNEVNDLAASPYTLDDLMACTEYEIQLKGFCSSDTSDFSRSIVFKTDGCCENPTDLALLAFDDSTATFEWSSVLAAQLYQLRIRELGSANWLEASTTMTSYQFVGLQACTEYEAQIQVECLAEMIDFSPSVTFQTRGCGACLDAVYCDPPDLDGGYEWIESVEVHTLNNTSGPNQGYEDFTNAGLTTEMATLGSYDIRLTPEFNSIYPFEEYFIIWIDFNQDGDFDDAGEMAFDPGGVTTAELTGTLTIPGDAALGLTRMRIGMFFEDPGTPCAPLNGFGEIEDYCITIIQGVECAEITGLDTMNVTAVSADLTWEMAAGAQSYSVRYKELSAADWTEVSSSTNSVSLDQLEPCADYEAQVKTVCDGEESAYSASKNFPTKCSTSITNAIEGLDEWTVFPVPFHQQLTVQFAFAQQQDRVMIELINQLGQRVEQQLLEQVPAGPQQARIQTERLGAGVYFVRLRLDSGEAITERLVKMD
ncbi:MAG: S8 family serine peptidase [Bacteroidota bacterium]